jgi:SpoVK/Ycf46/Vps4 family AAA+-type ATPase
MCTNRPDAIDPAVARRAAHIFHLDRPSDENRRALLTLALNGATQVSDSDIERVAKLLGPTDQRHYGVTYSDLRQRFLPDAVLDAFARNEPLTGERLLELATDFEPTRPFEASEP